MRALEVDLRRVIGPSLRKVQAARALRTSPAALDRWIDRGLLPIVVGDGLKRAEIETEPVLALAERVAHLRSQGSQRPLGRAVRELGWTEDPEGRQVLSAAVAALPRPNVSAVELRSEYRATTPAARVRMAAELSRTASVISSAGAAGVR